MMRLLVTILILLCFSMDNQLHSADKVISTGSITNTAINEISGIAASGFQEDVIWAINDSGNKPLIFAVNAKGNYLGTLSLQGVKNNDWEDMASFNYEGENYLLIADVGDNKLKRESYFLYIVKEPDINKLPDNFDLSVKPAWLIEFTYEDGSHNCESVAVDIKNENILLLTKGDKPPILYKLPLRISKKTIAKRSGKIKPFPELKQKDIREMLFSNYMIKPTAMDITADGSSAIVLTYLNAYYYKHEKTTDWLSVFQTPPKEIILPFMLQAESVCFDKSGNNIYVTSEGVPAPLFKIDLTKVIRALDTINDNKK